MLPLFILALFILYGIPSLVVIFFIRWFLVRYSTKKRAIIFTITSTCLLLLAGIVVIVWSNAQRTHYMSHTFCNEVMIELTAFQLDAFLDSPVEFECAVKDIHGSILAEERFVTNGTDVEITSTKNESLTLQINGQLDRLIVFDSVKTNCEQSIRINSQFELQSSFK